MRLSRLATLLLLFSLPILLSGQPLRDLKKQGHDFINRGLFWEAQAVLESYHFERPTDTEVNALLAQVYMQNNKYQAALDKFTWLSGQRKRIESDLILGEARANQLLGHFADAAHLYKQYLQLTKTTDHRRSQIIDELKRCSVGIRLAYLDDKVVVENMGRAVNSPYHDLMPIESPNYSGTMYFSSGRTSRFVDDFDRQGNLKSSEKHFDFDMMSSQIINGAWSAGEDLNSSLNTSENEFLLDFTQHGQVAVFARPGLESCPIFVDTFNVNTAAQRGVSWTHAIDFGDRLPQGVYFFSDSVALFASDQYEGFGGYDIFLATQGERKGRWEIVNLGPTINSEYDEVSPFLAEDGRTLYYSSNGTRSMGSFDVLRCRYDDIKQDWLAPENLGLPINSGADDLYFRLSLDGSTGFFASNRSGTEGGLDLHSIYYQSPPKEQITRSIPLLFSQVPSYVLFRQSLVSEEGSAIAPIDAVRDEFVMPALYFTNNSQLITPQNAAKLDRIISFLKTYPHVKIEVASLSDQSPVTNFDLYFSLKRGEQVAQYMIDRGIEATSIKIRGYGGSYPLALNALDSEINAAGKWFNRRVDIMVLKPEQLPILIKNELPEVAPAMKDSSYHTFQEARDGLNYRVLVATLDQMFKGDVITKFPDPMVEQSDKGGYRYYSGLFSSFEQVLQHFSRIKRAGYLKAEIVPFIGKRLLDKGNIDKGILDQYQDLKEYLLYIE